MTSLAVVTFLGLTLAEWVNVAQIVGFILTPIGFLWAVYQYAQQGKQKRAEYFFSLRKRLEEDPSCTKIFDVLLDVPEKLRKSAGILSLWTVCGDPG